jgi:hypothetical protein
MVAVAKAIKGSIGCERHPVKVRIHSRDPDAVWILGHHKKYAEATREQLAALAYGRVWVARELPPAARWLAVNVAAERLASQQLVRTPAEALAAIAGCRPAQPLGEIGVSVVAGHGVTGLRAAASMAGRFLAVGQRRARPPDCTRVGVVARGKHVREPAICPIRPSRA